MSRKLFNAIVIILALAFCAFVGVWALNYA